jgi:hypothetical protein
MTVGCLVCKFVERYKLRDSCDGVKRRNEATLEVDDEASNSRFLTRLEKAAGFGMTRATFFARLKKARCGTTGVGSRSIIGGRRRVFAAVGAVLSALNF